MRRQERRLPRVAVARASIGLGLALLTLGAFAGVLKNDFIELDDPTYVTENPRVRAGLTLEGVVWAFKSLEAANWHPLTWVSHMADVSMGGLDPSVHHATSLLLHATTTILLFSTLSRLTRTVWRSAFAAALFGVHPLHVESVAWVAERKDVLSGLFFVLTLLAYARWVERPSWRRYVLTLALFAAGLLAKPMVVTLPFVLLLLDFWPLGRFRPARGARGEAWRLVLEKTPFFLLTAASSAMTLWAQNAGGAVRDFEHFPLSFRAANAVVSYAAYLGKTIWPGSLAFFYPHPAEVSGGGISATHVIVGSILLSAATTIALASWRRRPHVTVGWLWYVGTLVPVIGIVQVGLQSMADRYTYLPLIGIFLLVSWEVGRLASSRRGLRQASCALLAGAALFGCALVTRAQVKRWRGNEALYMHALEVTRNNYLAHNNHGIILGKRGRLEEAMAQFREAIRIRPTYALAHGNLGSALAREGNPREALPHLEVAVRLDPASAQAHNNLGKALADAGRPDLAVEPLEQALRLDPRHVRARHNLARALAAQGKRLPALEQLAETVRRKPDHADAHADLGLLLSDLGRHEQATESLREALRLEPARPDAMVRLAWLLATSENPRLRRPEEAVHLARDAIERTGGRGPDAYDALAAALAAAGRFPEARQQARSALRLAIASGQTALAVGIRMRLEAYESGRPWIERPGPATGPERW